MVKNIIKGSSCEDSRMRDPTDTDLRRKYTEALAAIKTCRTTIPIICPPEADKDAVYSSSLLHSYLRAIQKRHIIFCRDRIIPRGPLYKYAPLHLFQTNLPKKKPQCAIVVDYGHFRKAGIDLAQLGESCFVIGFDHHSKPADDFPKNGIQIVNSEAPSTTQVIADFFDFVGFPLTIETATFLAVGIYADTNYLADGHRTSATFQTITRCIGVGIPWQEIVSWRPKTLNALKLAGRFASGFIETIGLAWLVADKKKMDKFGGYANFEEARDLVWETREVKICALITEELDGSWKISLRSSIPDKVSVAAIARELGEHPKYGHKDKGGGHHQSAAAKWTGTSKQALAFIRTTIAKNRHQRSDS